MAAPSNGNGSISRSNFTIIIGAASVLITIVGAFLNQQNNATDKRITELNAAIDKRTLDLKDEIVDNRKTNAKLTADNAAFQKEIARIDADRKHLEDEVFRLRPMIVSREEHASADRERQTIIGGIASRVDRIERDFGATYSLKDALADMQKRMDRISSIVMVPAGRKAAPTE